MSIFHQVDINFAAAFLLFLVSVVAFYRLDIKDKLSRAYLITALIIIFQLMFEALTVILDRNADPLIIQLRVFMSMALFLGGPILSLYWMQLLRKMLIPRAKTIKGYKYFIIVPQIFNVTIVLLTPFTDWVFYIDENAIYQRGDFFLVSTIFTYYYMMIAVGMIFNNRKGIVKEDLILLLIATSIPMLGGVIQATFYGTLFIWPSVAFALILLYLFLQQRIIHHDFLTGAWTRESFFQYVSQKIATGDHEPCGALYIDLDNLKDINDEHGHQYGDKALKKVVEVTKNTLGHKSIISRLGGDEFIGVILTDSKDILKDKVVDIKAQLVEFNETKTYPFDIVTSVGYDLFSDDYQNFEHFINHIDQLMYDEKRKHKGA
ncbi:MAG: diguanylate cyclase [Acholeplasma sp.]|nr:diguanylate cyclase [Acholeplasma sp.]